MNFFDREFKDHLRRRNRGRRISNIEIEKIVNKDFGDWFPHRVCIIYTKKLTFTFQNMLTH